MIKLRSRWPRFNIAAYLPSWTCWIFVKITENLEEFTNMCEPGSCIIVDGSYKLFIWKPDKFCGWAESRQKHFHNEFPLIRPLSIIYNTLNVFHFFAGRCHYSHLRIGIVAIQQRTWKALVKKWWIKYGFPKSIVLVLMFLLT